MNQTVIARRALRPMYEQFVDELSWPVVRKSPGGGAWIEALEPRRLLNAGMLDETFGGGGVVITDPLGNASEAMATLALPGGKVLVAGRSGNSDGLALVRYNVDGSVDAAFGEQGVARFSRMSARADRMALDGQGRIVVIGDVLGQGEDHLIVRFNADGSLDATFGRGGYVAMDFGAHERARGLAITADGKIVVTGEAPTARDFATYRLNEDGSLDTSFGGGGIVMTSFDGAGTLSDSDWATAVAIGPDGKVLVVGQLDRYVGGGGAGYPFHSTIGAVRYNADGSIDESFGSAGTLNLDMGCDEVHVADVVVTGDGRIVIGGDSYTLAGGSGMLLVRLNGDGTRDESFGQNGRVLSGEGPKIRDLLVDPQGRIYAAGWTEKFAIGRFNADGSVDETFGSNGLVELDDAEYASGIDLDDQGHLVAAGEQSWNARGQEEFVVARFNVADAPVPPPEAVTQPKQEPGGSPDGSSPEPYAIWGWSQVRSTGFSGFASQSAQQDDPEAEDLLAGLI